MTFFILKGLMSIWERSSFDMIEVLRWVNKPISSFGGDPNEVTLAGQSTGATSVTVLLLAPKPRGYYIILK